MRRLVTVSLGLLLLIGCGGKNQGGVLTGTITYQGKPVNGAAIFLHAPGAETGLLIPVDQEGKFRSTDVPPGEYKVVVQGAAGSSGPPTQGMSPEKMAEAKEKIAAMKSPPTIPFPDKYKSTATSDLKVTVVAGEQTVKLELKD
jgi:hypothetical protein